MSSCSTAKSCFALLFMFFAITGCGTKNLHPWHEVSLDSEFKASMEGKEIPDFQAYLDLEDELFNELRNKLPPGDGRMINRFSAGSLSDPARRQPDWNRTQELDVESPRGGVLMLHGLTDSPYTMRSLGMQFANQGFHVIALRLPAHGTAPSALNSFEWEDVSAAVRIALRHLTIAVDDKPVHVVGYSFGGSLAVNVAIDAYERDDLAVPASLVLMSPAIGVTGAAAFAGTVDTLSAVFGLNARRWSRIVPEFDPYKYNSFTFNAGAQVYQLSRHVGSRIEKRKAALDEGNAILPPVLVLQSTLDTTVSAQAIIDRLLDQLNVDRHELVLFDMNRIGAISELLIDDPGPFTARTMARNDLPFTMTLVTNRNDRLAEVELRRKRPQSTDIDVSPLGLAWPEGIFSLSHIALPFPPDDPLYGASKPEDSDELFLGGARFVGETGQLVFPASWLMRLRHNPFYDYLERRAVGWIMDNG